METTRKEYTARPVLEPLAVDMDGVRQLLGTNLSQVTIWRLEKRGKLKRVPGVRSRLYTVSSIRSLVETAAVDPCLETRGGAH